METITLEETKDNSTRQWFYQRRLKRATLVAYGGLTPKCECCGEHNIEFLVIDHINGGGNKERKANKLGGSSFYRWLAKAGYPAGYRVLCSNCNISLGLYGYCPHKE